MIVNVAIQAANTQENKFLRIMFIRLIGDKNRLNFLINIIFDGFFSKSMAPNHPTFGCHICPLKNNH
ncbi:hypothetical protein FACS1894123_05800 [Bacteroidia bacterium]|nr:hypothetical protein FACS1894123_05800 [Bacteroidia bacterium]